MKSKMLFVSLLILPLVIAGCGTKLEQKDSNLMDAANIYDAAQDLSDNINNPKAISSEESINNLYILMNYQGAESEVAMKSAISRGIDDGKGLGDLNEELVLQQDLGGAYMIGYVFGCQSIIGDEDKCNDDMGDKYQIIMMKELQNQFPDMDIMVE